MAMSETREVECGITEDKHIQPTEPVHSESDLTSDQGILVASSTPEPVSTQPTETERSDPDMIVPKISIPKPWRGETKIIAAARFILEYPKLVRSRCGYQVHTDWLPESTAPQAAHTTSKTTDCMGQAQKLVGTKEGSGREGLSRVGGALGKCPVRVPRRRKRNIFDIEDDEEEEEEEEENDDDEPAVAHPARLDVGFALSLVHFFIIYPPSATSLITSEQVSHYTPAQHQA
jgi:hypothetical protein